MSEKLEVDPGELEIADELIAERRTEQPGQTPETMTSWQRPITAIIDVLNLWVGRVVCLMLVPIIFVMVYEVVANKLFTAPTLWVYDVSRMLAGVFFMLGAGYALLRGVHIRADFPLSKLVNEDPSYNRRRTLSCFLFPGDAVLLLERG